MENTIGIGGGCSKEKKKCNFKWTGQCNSSFCGRVFKGGQAFIEDGVHSQSLIRSFRVASNLAISKIKELVVSIEGKSMEEKKSLLAKCAATTLSSKLIGGEKEIFTSMVVDSVISIGNDDRLNMIGIKKVTGFLVLFLVFYLGPPLVVYRAGLGCLGLRI
ncbi:hypothetical protein IFM89_038442 [Coptis chinensis]|uniref:Uncharacterized protein n=1 Tax=Coptis chinensis TaxID=261450 RepID=A0A835I892_9MAGN|nr:hypothetical protein IFM89_038442 [Coptis chinensis]